MLGSLSLSHVALAQTKGLIVSPKRVMFDPQTRVQELTLANRGSEKQKYRISIVNRKMLANGNLIEAETPGDDEFFASDVLRYGPRQIELEPKQSQKIRVMSRLSAKNEDGEYRSHVLIQEIPKAEDAQSVVDGGQSQLGIAVQAIFGITVPVFIRKGDLDADIKLSAPKVVRNQEGAYVNVNVERSGTKSVFGTAKVFDGVKQVALLKGVAVYLSTPNRVVSIPVPEQYAGTLSGKKLRITFGKDAPEEDAPDAEVSFTAK